MSKKREAVQNVTRPGPFACTRVARGGAVGERRAADASCRGAGGGVVPISCRVDEAGAGLVGVWARLVVGIA